MAKKMIKSSVVKKFADYAKFDEDFNAKSEERLRYFAATGEKLTYCGMCQVNTPFRWVAFVFIAADNETQIFLSMQKTVFLSKKEIGATYIVREKKSKVYILD